MKLKVVLDTNVIVAALRSSQGASYALLQKLGLTYFDHILTVPLLIEYEDVLFRQGLVPLDTQSRNDILDFICATALRHKVHYLWRPKLRDYKDDMVLEAAVNGQCDFIVTHNVKDFSDLAVFGLKVCTPKQFLLLLREEQAC